MRYLTQEQYAEMESAWKYQDFITKKLFEIGIVVNAFQSMDYQMEYGESLSGVEIKNDRQMESTKNIYIEFYQKTMRGSDKESGIMQKDSSWLYVIGDYHKFYIFAKNQLQSLLSKVQAKPSEYWEKHHIRITQHKNESGEISSMGMVIPCEYAEKSNLMIRKVEIK